MVCKCKLLQQKWLEKFQTERKLETVNGYLHPLLHLCNFVKACHEILQIKDGQSVALALTMKYWLKMLRKGLIVRKWDKCEDLERIAGQEDFEALEKAEPVKRAMKILSEYMGSYQVIDYLMQRTTLLAYCKCSSIRCYSKYNR